MESRLNNDKGVRLNNDKRVRMTVSTIYCEHIDDGEGAKVVNIASQKIARQNLKLRKERT